MPRVAFLKTYFLGQELPEINRDNHYSTHFQEIRSLNNIHNVMPVREYLLYTKNSLNIRKFLPNAKK